MKVIYYTVPQKRYNIKRQQIYKTKNKEKERDEEKKDEARFATKKFYLFIFLQKRRKLQILFHPQIA